MMNRVLSKSRDIKSDSRPLAKVEISGQRLQTVRKAHAVQWLCFLPPPSLSSVEVLRAELLARALEYRYFQNQNSLRSQAAALT